MTMEQEESNSEGDENISDKISSHAAELLRSNNAHDRFLEMSFKMDDLRQQQEIERRHFEGMYNYSTPRKLNETNKDLTHKPELNSLSLEIASRLPTTSKERLFSGAPKAPSSPRLSDDTHYTFRPQINKKSEEIELNKQNIGFEQRLYEMYKKTSNAQKKIEEKKKELMEKELEGCTFTPDVAKTVNKVQVKGKNIEDRTMIWEMRRRQKLLKGRMETENKQMEGCTFSPNTQRLKLPSPKTSGDPLGFDEYLSRQRQAREKKLEQEKVFKTGDKWKNQITIPREFSFGAKDGIKIKALQKPVTNDQANRKTNHFNSSMDQASEPIMYLGDGSLEFDEDNENLITKISIHPNDVSEMTNESRLQDIPPQGLFSSKTSITILDGGMNDSNNFNSSMQVEKFAPMTSLKLSKEWLRRSQLKDEKQDSTTSL
ncbi:hypothetical protein C9374_005817 [Naegleria lovaniensis]|uniref:Uncharacterized protein n=1 Tax=Naegleria lovaniensis TaxID=51637 RepID=A0AA88KJX5_NAELO|nr:uncharacterized protein C9374_005817 [Naegleria lovaniensis]KAG2382025.1 hypothetical protein C9374_005817 [Naegleria lovaniensis]